MLQYLSEAHALEAGLASTLIAHIAITPRGDYRQLLERHRAETLQQRDRLQERLTQLGVKRSPMAFAYGVAQTVTGQALSFGKLPLDLLRGGSGEEKLLKNAKDEAASEALEIATYDAIEALANAVDDPKTATLAREHRAQEERFLAELREQIPALAGGVKSAEIDGEPTYDASKTGAADTARRTAKKAGAKAGQAVVGARETAQDAVDSVEQTARSVASEVRDEARKVPGEAELENEVRGSVEADADLPIADFETLSVEQILPKLRSLSAPELAQIDGHERGGRSRKRILDRVSALREKRVEEELAKV